jgi:hypothetical protein
LNPNPDTDPDPAFQVNPDLDTDPDPIRIQSFADQKLKEKIQQKICLDILFGSKIAIYCTYVQATGDIEHFKK